MLLRVGSRGSRLALTQAELAVERAARARASRSRSCRSRPPATATARSPFGEIGARGVFVKELEEALLDGRIDVAVHSAKDMTSTDTDGLAVGAYLDARGSARRALRRGRAPARDADRDGVGAAAGAAARARADALDRAAARQHRHAPAQARRARARRDRARRVRARPARARRRDRAPLRPGARCSRRPGRARSRCRCGRARRSSSRRADDAETRRRVEAERAASRVIGGGCLAPVAAHHDGATLTALVAAEDGALDRAAQRRRSRRGRRASCSLCAAVRVVVTRPRGAGRASSPARLEALGHEVVVCPLIEIEPLGDEPVDVDGYDWVVVTSANGADELAAAHARARRRGSRRSAAATRAPRSAAPTSCPRVSTQEGLLAELPRPAGRVLFAGAEGARRLLVDELGADFVPLYRTRELVPAEAPARRPRRARVRLGRARVRRAPASTIARRLDRAGDDRRRARGRRRRGRRGARRTTSTGSSPRSRGRRVNLRAVFITFLTDFGLQDDFVGTCHGVIKRIAPDAQIIDITHGIPPQQVLQGALVLANTLPYMPVGVHLAVVDPGRRRRAPRRSRCATRRARSTSAPTTACSFPPPSARRRSPRRTSSRTRSTRSSRSRARSTAATSSRRRPRTRARRRARELGPPVDSRRARPARPARAGGRPSADPRDRALRRPLRQHRSSTSRASTSTRSGIVPGTQVELELGGERVLRRRRADVRRRAAGRHHPLRGQLPEHLARDQRRQRGRDALRARRPEHPHQRRCCPEHGAGCTGAGGLRVSRAQGRSRHGSTGPDVLLCASRVGASRLG